MYLLSYGHRISIIGDYYFLFHETPSIHKVYNRSRNFQYYDISIEDDGKAGDKRLETVTNIMAVIINIALDIFTGETVTST